MALDYRIDRPIVAGVRLDPPVIAHGLPVRIDALLLAPQGVSVAVSSVDVCGLRDDLIVALDAQDCYTQPELVTHLGDSAPTTWEPPDLSAIACPPSYGYDTGLYPDTGGADTDTDTDPPTWDIGACRSYVPLRVQADAGGEPFYGGVAAFLRVEPYDPTEFVPTPLFDKPRSLTSTGDAVAGGVVELEFRVDAAIDDEGFRWWVDGGELLGTGRTALHNVDGDARITHNTLRIPADWEGPLRVFVVVESLDSDVVPYSGDLAWESLTLEVP